MYERKQHARAWAAIPVIVLILAIGLIAGPAANAADLKLASSGFVVGFVLVLIGGLLALGSRRSATTDDDSVIGGVTK